MKALLPHVEWGQLLTDLKRASTSNERERLIVNAFRMSVKREGGFTFVPSLTVQKTLADRTLYHLVFGTRNPAGLDVFRSSQVKALEAQATVRSKAKDERSTALTGQGMLWGGIEREAHDFSTRQIQEGSHDAVGLALRLVQKHERGIKWSDLWPRVLDDFVVTKSALGRSLNELRKKGRILAPSWPSERKLIPPDYQLFLPIRS